MIGIIPLIFAITVAPADRMQMADKMFAKGMYREAAQEYAALRGESTLEANDLMFREAECDHALGREKEAQAKYAKLLKDSGIEKEMRSAVLYRVASAKEDASLFRECAKVNPNGKYAGYARLKLGMLLARSANAKDRREAMGIFLDLAGDADRTIAEEAVYSAAILAYTDSRWNEAAILFKRLKREFPNGKRAANSEEAEVWSAFLAGRYSDAMAICEKSKSDDASYLRGAIKIALDDKAGGLKDFVVYLEAFPEGKYRKEAETAVERAKFEEASAKGDNAKAIEAAERAAKASGRPFDALRLAWAHAKAGNEDAAHGVYMRIVKTWPEDPVAGEALFADALAMLRKDNWSGGEMRLEELLKRFPAFERKAEALYWRGAAAMHLGHGDDGMVLLTAALKAGLDMDKAREAKLMMAENERTAGRDKAAAKLYAELIASGAGERMGSVQLAETAKILIADGKVREAERAAKELGKRGGDPQLMQIAGAVEGAALEANGKLEEAMAAYRRALKENARTPEAAKAALALGLMEYRKGEYDNAETTLADAVKRNAEYGERDARKRAYRLLADVCRAKGDKKGAEGYETIVRELFSDK